MSSWRSRPRRGEVPDTEPEAQGRVFRAPRSQTPPAQADVVMSHASSSTRVAPRDLKRGSAAVTSPRELLDMS